MATKLSPTIRTVTIQQSYISINFPRKYLGFFQLLSSKSVANIYNHAYSNSIVGRLDVPVVGCTWLAITSNIVTSYICRVNVHVSTLLTKKQKAAINSQNIINNILDTVPQDAPPGQHSSCVLSTSYALFPLIPALFSSNMPTDHTNNFLRSNL